MIRDPRVQTYLEDLRPERDPVLAEMEELAGSERIPIVEWETGRLLATLVAAKRPRRVLEVGTAIGYSTIHMARELPPDGRIVTLERDPKRIAQARDFWARADVSDRIELVAGDALLVVDNLLMSGEAALPEGLDTSWGEASLRAARATTRALMDSPEWLVSLLPVGDGVGLGARRGTVRP